MPWKDRRELVAWMLLSGAFLTFVHDYTYRRTGGDDYELWGYVSHAGSDMLIVTIGSAIAALLWSSRRR